MDLKHPNNANCLLNNNGKNITLITPKPWRCGHKLLILNVLRQQDEIGINGLSNAISTIIAAQQNQNGCADESCFNPKLGSKNFYQRRRN
jgi:hypothetical protein